MKSDEGDLTIFPNGEVRTKSGRIVDKNAILTYRQSDAWQMEQFVNRGYYNQFR